MKKFSVVLLIAVLAASLVFAADPKFTGNAEITTKFNLDDLSFDTVNTNTAKVTLTFDFGNGKPEKVGEGDVYAEIAGSFKLNISFTNKDKADSSKYDTEAKITKANIVVKDIVVIDILGVKSSTGFAKDFDTDSDGNEIDNFKLAMPAVGGVTVTTPKLLGAKIGFGWNAGIKAKTYNVGGSLQLDSIKLMEDAVEVKLAGYGWLSNVTAKRIGAAAKVSYTAEKINAYAAVDAEYVSKNIDLEARLHASYDAYAFDAYYLRKSGDNEISFQATADVNENISVWANVYDILDFERATHGGLVWALVGASVKNIADVLDVKAEVGYLQKSLFPSLEATYKNEMFTAKAGVSAIIDFSNSFKFTALSPYASIESTKIVNNATIKLAYTGAEFIVPTLKSNGTIALSAKVAF